MRSAALVLIVAVACSSSPGSAPNGQPLPPDHVAAGTSDDGGGPDRPGPADLSLPAPRLRFVAVGDTGKGTPEQKEVAKGIATVCAQRGCDFVQLLGDNIYQNGVSGTDDPAWQDKFELPYAGINLLFYAVLGNHDYGPGGLDLSKGKHQVDYSSVSKKWRMPGEYWHRTQAHVELFGLDTNKMMFGQDDEQRRDVLFWLLTSQTTWKIALGHHPYLSNGSHGNAGNYDGWPAGTPVVAGDGVKSFLEDVVCGKVDLYLAGHDHSQQWLMGTCKGTELIVSGTGAEATKLDQARNPFHYQSLELGFVYLDIEGKRLTASFHLKDGKEVFARSLTKP
jgi:hypothetical protein